MAINAIHTTSYMEKVSNNIFIPALLVLFFMFSACSNKSKLAESYLSEAESALESGNYALAKLKIDSIKIISPDAFDAIRKGFDLMQEVRMAENIRNIAFCDSMLRVNYDELKNVLKGFNYERDPQYQEFGDYIPKVYPLKSALTQNSLRSAVSEKGQMYIESVFTGAVLKHNKIKVTAKDGSYAESLTVTSDGFNYQFKTLSTSYEIVRFQGNDENGVARFVFTFKDEPLTVTFIGQNSRTIPLSENSKKAIAQSYELSTLLLEIENLKYEKGRSEALINYLESKKT